MINFLITFEQSEALLSNYYRVISEMTMTHTVQSLVAICQSVAEFLNQLGIMSTISMMCYLRMAWSIEKLLIHSVTLYLKGCA